MNLYLSLTLLAITSQSLGKPGFVLLGPTIYHSGTNETLVLNLFGVTGNGELLFQFITWSGQPLFRYTVEIQNGQDKVIKMPIPSTLSDQKTQLQISGSIGNYTILRTAGVELKTPKPIAFVNTDKPLYKAEETVKIRILVTDNNLKPLKTAKEGAIWVTDPNRVRVAQWLNVSFNKGLLHKELSIPKEPPLGSWTIHVKVNDDIHTRVFEVKEYVLPLFEVKIVPPTCLLKNSTNITWKVCAKYTYGKPVKGDLIVKLEATKRYWNNDIPTIEKRMEIDGCEDISFNISHLVNRFVSYIDGYELFAKVIEKGTGIRMNSSSSIKHVDYAYVISRQDSSIQHFKPRIPLRLTMEVKTPDSKPLPGELIKVCIKIEREILDTMRTIADNLNICKNYTSNEYGYVIFTIPPQDSTTMFLEITVEAADPNPHSKDGLQLPRNTFQLKPWYSPSGSHLQIEILPRLDCSAFGSDVRVTQGFYYTFNDPGIRKIYYQVMARGEILKSGNFEVELTVRDDENSTDDTYMFNYPLAKFTDDGFPWGKGAISSRHVGKFTFPIEFTADMVPKVRLLLYTVLDDGEIVADSTWHDTDACFANKISMSFHEKKIYPGSKASIYLTAEPRSLCSVGVVDKSVQILNEGDKISESKVTDRLRDFDAPSRVRSQRSPNHCSAWQSADHMVGAITAFELGGWVILSDLKLETRPCRNIETTNVCSPPPHPYPIAYDLHGPPGLPGFSAATQPPGRPQVPSPVPQAVQTPSVTVRTDFRETWLFDLYTIGEEGKLVIDKKIPDSVTEWQGETVCIHPVKGLGLSKPASIVAFQPFFVSLALPYSVIRNETLPVVVSVFNYLKACLQIELFLDKTEDFVLLNGALTKNVCVCGEQSVTESFYIKPIVLGDVNITVTAATSKYSKVCGNLDIAHDVKRSDTITKPILVEAEGFLKEETTNTFFCMDDNNKEEFMTKHLLRLPANTVKDSERAFCFLTGDIMGPTLEGLDQLIRMPTGCGEQNMIGLVPNIVVLDYLKATGRLTKKLEEKALNNIRQGYIREENYKHPNGSYSAFGSNDKEGSMWLTAFVVRTFASAQRHISINEQSLAQSRNWVLSQQESNGCFPMVGTVHHQEMKGGIAKNDGTTSALTAYILISMLEYGEMEKSKIVSALRCLEAMDNPSNYSLALFAYAASLTKDPSAFSYLQRLIDNAERESSRDSYIYWRNADRSISIETAGYAILALLQLNRDGDFEIAASIARWLTEQRNPYGGFYSTQDTVVALQALGKYGAQVNRQQMNMDITIQSDDTEESYKLTEDNELLTQRLDLKLSNPKTDVSIVASGTGCALVQTLLRYNLPIPEHSKDFALSVKTLKTNDDCKKAKILICVRYNHPNGSNMAIVEIKIVSGYFPVKNSLEKLLQKTNLAIRRYEIGENSVNIYFDSLTEKINCFNFDVYQEIEILDAKPANVKVYDYYDNEKAVSVSYSLEERCPLWES